jgi:hypothetical protein
MKNVLGGISALFLTLAVVGAYGLLVNLPSSGQGLHTVGLLLLAAPCGVLFVRSLGPTPILTPALAGIVALLLIYGVVGMMALHPKDYNMIFMVTGLASATICLSRQRHTSPAPALAATVKCATHISVPIIFAVTYMMLNNQNDLGRFVVNYIIVAFYLSGSGVPILQIMKRFGLGNRVITSNGAEDADTP